MPTVTQVGGHRAARTSITHGWWGEGLKQRNLPSHSRRPEVPDQVVSRVVALRLVVFGLPGLVESPPRSLPSLSHGIFSLHVMCPDFLSLKHARLIALMPTLKTSLFNLFSKKYFFY